MSGAAVRPGLVSYANSAAFIPRRTQKDASGSGAGFAIIKGLQN